MNVHPLSLIAALAVGLLIGMVGWHSSRAMSDRDRAPHDAKPEAVAMPSKQPEVPAKRNNSAHTSDVPTLQDIPATSASAKPEPPNPELQASVEKVIVWAQTERTGLLASDRAMPSLEKDADTLLSLMSEARRLGRTDDRYSESSERRIRRSLAEFQQANSDLADGLAAIEAWALLLRESEIPIYQQHLSASMDAYLVLRLNWNQARMKVLGSVQAFSSAARK